MEPFILFLAVLVTIADSLAFADHVKKLVLHAPFTFAEEGTLLLLVSENKVGICDLDQNRLINEIFVLQGHERAHVGLQRLAWTINSRVFFNFWCRLGRG